MSNASTAGQFSVNIWTILTKFDQKRYKHVYCSVYLPLVVAPFFFSHSLRNDHITHLVFSFHYCVRSNSTPVRPVVVWQRKDENQTKRMGRVEKSQTHERERERMKRECIRLAESIYRHGRRCISCILYRKKKKKKINVDATHSLSTCIPTQT